MLSKLSILQKSLLVNLIVIASFIFIIIFSYTLIQKIDQGYLSSSALAKKETALKDVIIGGLLFNSASGVVFMNGSDKAKKTMVK